ncbi:MAG: hypothetical protein R3B90_14620 [Planctomycetaceae bacterium]
MQPRLRFAAFALSLVGLLVLPGQLPAQSTSDVPPAIDNQPAAPAEASPPAMRAFFLRSAAASDVAALLKSWTIPSKRLLIPASIRCLSGVTPQDRAYCSDD